MHLQEDFCYVRPLLPSHLPPVGHCSFYFQVYLLWMLVWVMVFVNHGLRRSSLSQRDWNFRVVWDSLQLNCLQVLLVKYIDTAPGFSLLVSKLSPAGSIDLRHPSLGVLDWLYSLIRIHRVITMAPLNWELRPSRKKVCLKCVVYIYVGKSYGIFLVIVIVVVIIINPLSAE